MTKTTFLELLEEALNDRDIDKQEIAEILEDYAMMIDEAIERDQDAATFIESLGSPRSIAKTIVQVTNPKERADNKWIAVSPFVALIIFFFLGFSYDAWHPAWLAFLLVPISAIALEVQKPLEKMTALSVFLALIAFMLLGTYEGLWHPMWALFLIIPGLGFLSTKKTLQKAFGVYTLAATTFYITYTLMVDPSHHYALIVLIPIPVMGLISGQISVEFSGVSRIRDLIAFILLGLFLLGIYIVIGLSSDLWHPTWLIFLLIPIAGLLYAQFIRKERIDLVAYTPFIALIIFFLWGEYGDAYAYSWLVFLLIPITAILFGDDD